MSNIKFKFEIAFFESDASDDWFSIFSLMQKNNGLIVSASW